MPHLLQNWVVDAIEQSKFSAKWLSATLDELFGNPTRLDKMAKKATVKNGSLKEKKRLLGMSLFCRLSLYILLICFAVDHFPITFLSEERIL